MDGLGTIPAGVRGSGFVHIFSGAFPGYLYTAASLLRVNLRAGDGLIEGVEVLGGGEFYFLSLAFPPCFGCPGRQFRAVSVLFTVFVYI